MQQGYSLTCSRLDGIRGDFAVPPHCSLSLFVLFVPKCFLSKCITLTFCALIEAMPLCYCHGPFTTPERERERERERETDRQTDRQTETKRDRDRDSDRFRDTDTYRETEADTERDRETESETD